MSDLDWASIKSDYVTTTMTLADVAEKWSVLRGTLSARATREKWNDDKQQFAANLEQKRRENILALRVAEHEKFESDVLTVARGLQVAIARQMKDGKDIDAAKVLKLANALQTIQQIGAAAFGK